MRFAYCYGVVDEIRNYRTNGRGWHLDTAIEFLEKANAYMLTRVGLPIEIYPDMYWQRQLQVSQQQAIDIEDALTRPPKWYRLRPETELILKAFGEFMPKLKDRLKDRKDLAAIETSLTHLAAYQYLEIPELSDSESETRFEEGMQSLLTFAQQLTALPPYRSEQMKPTPKQKFSEKFLAAVSTLTAPFAHDNVLVAFLYWFVFLSLLLSGSVLLWLRILQVKMDTTLLAALLTTTILGALTAVTIPRIGKKKS